MGLLIGAGIVAFLELRDKSFWTEAEVMDMLSLAVLATVPYVATAAELEQRKKRRLLAAAGGVTCAAVMGYVTWTMQLWNSIL